MRFLFHGCAAGAIRSAPVFSAAFSLLLIVINRLLLTTLLACLYLPAFAVRPFITDDAAVVGRRLFQLETWLMFERFSGEHWAMLAYGPHKRVEVALGAVWGYEQEATGRRQLSYAAPLLEAKYLIRDYAPNNLPGIAIAAGTFLPAGQGDFVPPAPGAYGFLALTQCFGRDENLLIHGNIGVSYLHQTDARDFTLTWGLGTQVKAWKGLHVVGEVVSGDPYVAGSGLLYQTGFRYFISDLIQVDATMGRGIGGDQEVPFWAGAGARIVMPAFRSNKG